MKINILLWLILFITRIFTSYGHKVKKKTTRIHKRPKRNNHIQTHIGRNLAKIYKEAKCFLKSYFSKEICTSEIAIINYKFQDIANDTIIRYSELYDGLNIAAKAKIEDQNILDAFSKSIDGKIAYWVSQKDSYDAKNLASLVLLKTTKEVVSMYQSIISHLPIDIDNISSINKIHETLDNYTSITGNHILYVSANEIITNHVKQYVFSRYVFLSPQFLGYYINFNITLQKITTQTIPQNLNFSMFLANHNVINTLASNPRMCVIEKTISLELLLSYYNTELYIFKKYNSFFGKKNFIIVSEMLHSNLVFSAYLPIKITKILRKLTFLTQKTLNEQTSTEFCITNQVYYMLNLSLSFLDDTNIIKFFNNSRYVTDLDYLYYKIETAMEKDENKRNFIQQPSFLNFFYLLVMPNLIDTLKKQSSFKEKSLNMLDSLYFIMPPKYALKRNFIRKVYQTYAEDDTMMLLYLFEKKKIYLNIYNYFNITINILFEIFIGINIDKSRWCD
ncbi:hypothetical protein COBT_001393 [Conglomerata obtusa]